MKKVLISAMTDSVATELYIGTALLKSAFFKEFCNQSQGKIVVITDCIVKDLYAVDLARQLNAPLLTIPNGERFKTQETMTYVMDTLLKIGLGRDAMLIAIGGGVVTDLVGFVASIYMRGIELMLIPTTLLSIVDASIGGKTAINTSSGKNLIGTIYHSKAIFADLDTLQTLPEKEWFNGLAEILKMALIYDPSIWARALKNDKDPVIILKAIRGKIAIIEQDPKEQALRRILNFGHTIGHALETITQYEMPHGQAVAMGCSVEAHLSMRLGYLLEKDFNQIQSVYSRFFLHLPKTYRRAQLLNAMNYDKKRVVGMSRFVLIDRIGHAIPFDGDYCRAVTPYELESTIDWMEGEYGL